MKGVIPLAILLGSGEKKMRKWQLKATESVQISPKYVSKKPRAAVKGIGLENKLGSAELAAVVAELQRLVIRTAPQEVVRPQSPISPETHRASRGLQVHRPSRSGMRRIKSKALHIGCLISSRTARLTKSLA